MFIIEQHTTAFAESPAIKSMRIKWIFTLESEKSENSAKIHFNMLKNEPSEESE